MGTVAGKGAEELSLARKLYRRLEEDWGRVKCRNPAAAHPESAARSDPVPSPGHAHTPSLR
jgi:hypothetical protein